MPKQLNVNLAFTADTSQAKRELQALQQELKKLAVDSLGDSSLGKYTKELQVARDAAVDLRNKLAEATDVNTGKLDLSKFSQSLKNGGMDLKDYQAQLANLGPAGDKAFASVANAILKAELPLKRTSGLLEQFKTTLMNTARWQISSNILHGFQGALQTAWHYAQDLNESLNNIQIVTQQSNEQMAQFAINANKAAHELSASTTTYTDAALIYYQQGLNDEQVKQRTDVTVKLANVTGDSASKVSEQMTAIWNNFDDGTKSLEHYADVLTALGAATASSSDEIAGGMQQFAASASTVGLSYEYAASALATVVATTRQSENVVGNAFKTLFARLEGLNLGETLDDGTTLNKYSAALDKVGISIKDQQGNMKAMDDILDELGAKWGTLAKDQQVALAQTVGGVRQYTQLIALMDNWGEFQKNLSIANESDGSLQEQADIYADSWQAAQKRVQTSLEEIYHDLIDDKAFIEVLDFIDNIIQGIDDIIKGVGGLKGVIYGVGALLPNIFGKELLQGLNDFTYNLNIAKEQEKAMALKTSAAEAMKDFGASNADEIVGSATNEVYRARGELLQTYLSNYERLTSLQKEEMARILDGNEAESQRVITLAQEVSAQEAIAKSLERQALVRAGRETTKTKAETSQMIEDNKIFGAARQKFENLQTSFKNGTISAQELRKELASIVSVIFELEKRKGISPELQNSLEETKKTAIHVSTVLSQAGSEIEVGTSGFDAVNESLSNVRGTLDITAETIVNTDTYFKDGANTSQEYADAVSKAADAAQTSGQNQVLLGQSLEGLNKSTAGAKETMEKIAPPIKTVNELLVESIQGVSSLIFALKSISGIIDTIFNKDMSVGEKITGIIGSLVILVPTLMRAYQALNGVMAQAAARHHANAVAQITEAAASKAVAGAKTAETVAVKANTVAWYANPITWIIALLGGAVIAISAVTKALEAQTAAAKESYDESVKHTSEITEEINKQKELYDAYQKAKSKYEENKENKEELQQVTLDLCEYYGIELDALDLLREGYDSATDSIRQFRLEKAKEQYGQVKADRIEQEGYFESVITPQFNNENDSDSFFGSHELANGNFVSSFQSSIEGNSEATAAAIKQIVDEQYSDIITIVEDSEHIAMDFAEGISQAQSAVILQDIYKQIRGQATEFGIDLTDTENVLYNNIKEFLNTKDVSEALKNWSTAANAELESALVLAEENIENIDSLTDAQAIGDTIENYRDALKAQLGAYYSDDELNSIIESYLSSSYQNIADYYNSLKVQDAALSRTNSNLSESTYQNVTGNQLMSDSASSVVNWADATDENFQQQYDVAQAYSDAIDQINEATGRLEQGKAALEAFGDGIKDAADITAVQEALGLSSEEIGQYLNLTSEQQKEYITDIVSSAQDELSQGTKNALSSLLAVKEYNQTIIEELKNSDSHSEEDAARLSEAEQILANVQNKISEIVTSSNMNDFLTALGAETIEQLEELDISAEVFNKRYSELRNALDEDIELEAFEDMSKYLKENATDVEGLSDQLTVNKKSAEAVSKAILRYDSAIQKVTDHYDEWIEALDSGNEYEQAEALKEVRNNFNDILDMPFDSLSDDFVNNRENLELMKEAAEGDEQAYNDLLEAANKDILTTVGLNDADFQAKYNDIKSKVDAGLQDIEAGAYIDDSQAIQAMNELINAAAMTADQATDLLASMGVDAEVEQVDVPADSKYAGADATITYDYAESPNLLVGGTDTTRIPVPNITYTATPEVVPGEMTATALRVKSARKSSGGGIKKSLSPSGGGGGSKGGGGGGGGGSTPKHQTVDRAAKKPTQKVEDRYHVINNQIEDLAKQYDRLSEAEERAFGKSKLALMDRQVEILKDQYEAQRKLRKEAEKYWAEDLANLKNASYDADGDGEVDTLGIEEYLKDNPISLKLDENGTILNYDELIDAANNRYNSFIAQYNAFIDGYNSLTAEQQESEKEKFEAEKEQWDKRLKDEDKYYENFLGLITQYEETQDKVQEEFNKEIEQYHEMLDKLLEKTEYQVKLRLDIDDDALKVIDFLMKTVADDALDAAQKIDLIGQQTALTLDKIKAETAGISGIFSNHFGEDHVFDTTSADLTENNFVKAMQAAGYTKAVNGDETKLQLDTDKLINDLQTGKTSLQNVLGSMEGEFTEEEIDKFREHVSNILDDTADLWQQRKDLFEAASEQIEASNDRLEKMADQIDHLNEVTGKYKDIMDILGHNGYYGITTKQITELAEAQHQMYVDSVAAAKARNDFAQNTLKTLKKQQEAYAEGTDMYNYYQGLIDEAQETANQTEQELMSDLEEALQHVRDTFDQTMELMAADASKILGGAMGSLEGLANIMDQYEKTHDTFVDGYEQVYRLNKLNAEAAKAIDETNNPKAKKELMKYQQEVLDQMRAYQEDGAQVSEWELQNLEKKLALRQAELALEEARNIKSQVRMQRDNEGNYSYVYTADEDNIADAEANYRDKLYEMQKANAEYIQQLQNDIVSLQQDALQQIAHAQETYGYGTEEYFKAVNQIETWYNEAVQDKYNQLELVMGANQDLQQFDLEFHSRITGDMMLKDQDYVTNFEQTVLSQQTGFATSQQAASMWNEALTGLIKGVEEETNLYKQNNEQAMNAAGLTLEQNKKGYTEWGEEAHKQADRAVKDSEKLKEEIEKYATTFDEQINGEKGVLADIKNWADTWSKIVDEMVKKNEGLANSMGEVIKKLSGIGEEIQKVKDAQPMKITVEQENTGNNDGTTAASVPVSVGGNGSSGGGNGTGNNNGSSSTGGQVTGTGQYKYISNGDRKTHTKKEKMSDDSWVSIGSEACYFEGSSNSATGVCAKCGQSGPNSNYQAPSKSVGTNTTRTGLTTRVSINSPEYRRMAFADTGMYTGDWGSTEGKLAVLHEKELVLNKEDTANMLAAVGMIRQISNVIDLNAKTAGGAFSQLIAAGVSTGAQELQQEVHITAEFPNATDKNEILEAFDNVINLASMYANRKV